MEDVITENQQAIEMTNIASNLLSQMMDAFASIISNNQNQVIKILTSVTIILSLPTLISSFYGMNVALPLQNTPHAFAWIALASGLIIGSVVLIFKNETGFRKGMVTSMTVYEIDVDTLLVQVRDLLEHGDPKSAAILLEGLRPADQAGVFDDLNPEEQDAILPKLNPEDSADILEELEEEDAVVVADRLRADKLASIMDHMEPDEAADLLGDIEPEKASRVF